MPRLLPRLLVTRRLVTRLLVAAALVAGAQFAATASRAADLVVAVAENLNGLDPQDLNDNISQAASRLTHEGLFKLDRDMKLVPALAESFEANEEATQFIFHLRKGREIS
jgi:glutathione transport system substrate-binding protein